MRVEGPTPPVADEDPPLSAVHGVGASGQRDTRTAVDAALLPSMFSGAPVAVVALDCDGAVTALTPTAERLLGRSESELVGTPLHRHLSHQPPDGQVVPEEGGPILSALRAARPAAGDDGVFLRQDGTTVVLTWAFAPTVLARTLTGGVLALHDTAAVQAEASRNRRHVAAVEEANVRLALLADVSRVLGDSDDVEQGLRAVADLVVPLLADWVTIDVLGEDGASLERVALSHRDPALHTLGSARLGPLPPLRPEMTSSLAQVLHGAPLQHQQVVPAAAAVDELAADRLSLARDLGAVEGLTAPLRARGRTLGAITLVRTDPTRPYRQADCDFAADLAARAAALLDTTRVLARQVHRAEQMQRALLPELAPRIGPLDLAGFYRPASDLSQVGGDWYDAFALPDDSTGLVLGDVAGHDLHAATRMGAIRHKLRALAGDRVAPASDVVARLDRVVQRFAPQDLATLVYARLRTAAGGARLQWSCAGHPPPLLLTPGMGARLLEGVVDLPIGVADLDRSDSEVAVQEHATLVLYSDGLVEHPGESLSEGLRRLREVGGELADVPLPDLGQELVRRMRPSGLDDVAILAARLADPA